jgi:low molecular weight protein-tyrosine phosphatase
MTSSILVVCTGNICRSPIAEGFLRDALATRFGAGAPVVSSAGTMGWEGSGAMPESIEVAAELGADIAGHRAHGLRGADVAEASLIVTMAAEHRSFVTGMDGDAVAKTFTLKELVRILEHLPPTRDADPAALSERVAEAAATRAEGFAGNPHDEDVADPLGMPLSSYRAIAWELREWVDRLVAGLYGPRAELEEAAP